MKHLHFVTGNEQKFSEVSRCFEELSPDITLDHLNVAIPEIQSDDPRQVLREKVAYARQFTRLPFIVDDAYFDTDRYPSFPGPYAKFINSTLGREGLERLFDEGDTVCAIANVALHYLGMTREFTGQIDGTMHFKGVERTTGNTALSNVMRLPSGLTLGEATQDPYFDSHRGKALRQLTEWLNTENRRSDQQKINISKRWSERSAGWKDVIADTDSYVNFEENYARVNALIRKYAPLVTGNALEIGCGTGEAGRILKQANSSLNVLSTDISEGMLSEAELQTREAGLSIEYRKADITKHDLSGNYFDMVLSRGVVVSHLPRTDIVDWLEAVTNHTRVGGYFLFDFIQSVDVGDVEKPIDSKNEFTLSQMDSLMNELGWRRVEDDGTDTTRVRVVCYRRTT